MGDSDLRNGGAARIERGLGILALLLAVGSAIFSWGVNYQRLSQLQDLIRLHDEQERREVSAMMPRELSEERWRRAEARIGELESEVEKLKMEVLALDAAPRRRVDPAAPVPRLR